MEKIEKRDNLIMALVLLVLGILFIVLKEQVMSVALTILGVAFVVLGIIDLFKKDWTEGAIKIIIGILAILFAWVITAITMYVLGAILIIWGIYTIIKAIKDGVKNRFWAFIGSIVIAILSVAAGVLIIIGNAGWMFIVIGIILLAEAIVTAINAFKK